MSFPKLVKETIKLEVSLANHYKAATERVGDAVLRAVFDLLGEESMVHAARLGSISEIEVEGPGDFSSAIDEIAVLAQELGELTLERDVRKQVMAAMRLENKLRTMYERLSILVAELEQPNVGPLLRSVAGDKDYHCSLLRSARTLLG